jgi:Flp pilus assembly protein TadB
MKIPTLFGRTPKHQKFTFEPRFYDAKKEEREERERRIRQQLESEKTGGADGYETRIKGSFHSARKRSSASQADLQASLIRIAILFVLVVMLVAYLQWGTVALYGMLVIIPIYAWLRFRR